MANYTAIGRKRRACQNEKQSRAKNVKYSEDECINILFINSLRDLKPTSKTDVGSSHVSINLIQGIMNCNDENLSSLTNPNDRRSLRKCSNNFTPQVNQIYPNMGICTSP